MNVIQTICSDNSFKKILNNMLQAFFGIFSCNSSYINSKHNVFASHIKNKIDFVDIISFTTP